MTPAEHVGARIRALRTERGLTHEAVGGRAGMARQNVVRAEHGGRGASHGPTLDTLVRIARALGVPVSALVEGL